MAREVLLKDALLEETNCCHRVIVRLIKNNLSLKIQKILKYPIQERSANKILTLLSLIVLKLMTQILMIRVPL
jgi:hypothetical protein